MILMGLLAPVALHLTPSPGGVKFLKVRNLGFKEFRKPCKMKQFRKIHSEQFLKFLRIFQWIIFAWKVSKYGVFSGPYFPVFGLNTKIYSVFIPNTGKYGPEKTPYNTFHAVVNNLNSMRPEFELRINHE